MEEKSRRIGIAEAARLLDRSPSTLRAWDRNGSMPKQLRPKRDDANRRYWTLKLIEQIKAWIEANNFYPGTGLSYHPSAEQALRHIHSIRDAVHERHNGSGPLNDLRDNVVDAFVRLGKSEDEIVRALPLAAVTMGVSLSDALVVVAEVVAEHDAGADMQHQL